MTDNVVFTETDRHVIEVSEGCLTIGTKQFPDNCVSLTVEETEEVLKLLLTTLKTKKDLKVDIKPLNVF